MTVRRLLRISRPRFWLYELGTFVVGVVAAYAHGAPASSILSISTAAFFAYFLFPANLYIYGINDIYDYETDRLNPKKTAYEALVMPDEHATLWRAILITTIPFAAFLMGAPISAWIAFSVFLFFACFYSAPPIRAKIRPGLDSLFSAGHYVATGVFGYLLVGATSLSYLPVAAAMFWAIAMHAYSAVPDIQADSEGGLATIATSLGKQGTILVCLVLYTLASVMALPYLGVSVLLLGAVYTALMVLSLFARSEKTLFSIYKVFPTVNALAGMAIFFLTLYH